MELGTRLKQARLEAGLSQRQLCGDVITRNMLSQIENGTAKPSMDTLRYLAAALGKPVSFFLEENAASPNQARMEKARQSFADENYAAVPEDLGEYQTPDPIFDGEYHLLLAMSCLALAEREPDPEKAAVLLAQAAENGSASPYYTPETERRRLLRLAEISPERCGAITDALPADDRELLLRARAALGKGDVPRSEALLEAACRRDDVQWLLLRGDAALAGARYERAEEYYRRAEAIAPQAAYPKLEQLYSKQENFKLAYYYACTQR